MRVGAMLRIILPALAQVVVLNSCSNLQERGDEHFKGQLQVCVLTENYFVQYYEYELKDVHYYVSYVCYSILSVISFPVY